MHKLFKKTPLAWRQLMKEKVRLAIAIGGIAFADVLMFFQLGMLDALYDSATNPHQKLQGDLVLVNRQVETLIDMKNFPRTRIHQTLAYDGVASADPVYVSFANWRNPDTHLKKSILVFGFDPLNSAFDMSDAEGNIEQLQMLNRVLFDRASRPEYGAIPQLGKTQGNLEAQVSDRVVQTVGLFKMGASFGADGNLLASDSTFFNLVRDRNPTQVDIGLIQLTADADLATVQAQLRAGLPNDVKVLTVPEFIQLEIDYWANQGTGFIFNLGVFVGFLVGIIIVYQILYSNVSEHLPEYATLKAMGYSDRYLLIMLMQEALILAALGFIPGFLVSIGLYQISYAATLLEIAMKSSRAVMVLFLTILMCGTSGAIAMRKLQSADPADIF
ncbi:MAG: ABC transporter permease DevC [Xenococcaceae cyanobacterium MO_188.B29]|nr:ABC transporter permease DevC [Xenococcaceae cyanobacterium MO_188.B29]